MRTHLPHPSPTTPYGASEAGRRYSVSGAFTQAVKGGGGGVKTKKSAVNQGKGKPS